MENWYDQNQDDLNYYFQKIIKLLEAEDIPINYSNEHFYEKYVNFVFLQNNYMKKTDIPLPLKKNLPKFKAKFTILPN